MFSPTRHSDDLLGIEFMASSDWMKENQTAYSDGELTKRRERSTRSASRCVERNGLVDGIGAIVISGCSHASP